MKILVERAGWVIGGMLLIGMCACLLVVSRGFEATHWSERRYLDLLIFLCGGGLIYLVTIARGRMAPGQPAPHALLVWIFAVGLAMRGFVFFSEPIETVDHFATDSGALTAQAFLALTRLAGEYDWLAYKVGLALLDVLVCCVLGFVLPWIGRSRTQLAIYWWNPFLIFQVHNLGRLEPLALILGVAALGLALRGWRIGAAGALGLGLGAKLWPFLLAPVVLNSRPPYAWRNSISGLAAVAVFVAVGWFTLAPVREAIVERDCGWGESARALNLYAGADGMESTALLGARTIAGMAGAADPQAAALTALLGMVALFALWQGLRRFRGGADMAGRCVWVVAAAFLLWPSHDPWHWLWLLPFLALAPSPALLLYTVLLPLDYLRIYLWTPQGPNLFDLGIDWLWHIPALFALALERMKPGWRGWLTHPG